MRAAARSVLISAFNVDAGRLAVCWWSVAAGVREGSREGPGAGGLAQAEAERVAGGDGRLGAGGASRSLVPRSFLPRLEVCFSFAELKQGLAQDLISSPKLDRYKLARQLTDKAVKVSAP